MQGLLRKHAHLGALCVGEHGQVGPAAAGLGAPAAVLKGDDGARPLRRQQHLQCSSTMQTHVARQVGDAGTPQSISCTCPQPCCVCNMRTLKASGLLASRWLADTGAAGRISCPSCALGLAPSRDLLDCMLSVGSRGACAASPPVAADAGAASTASGTLPRCRCAVEGRSLDTVAPASSLCSRMARRTSGNIEVTPRHNTTAGCRVRIQPRPNALPRKAHLPVAARDAVAACRVPASLGASAVSMPSAACCSGYCSCVWRYSLTAGAQRALPSRARDSGESCHRCLRGLHSRRPRPGEALGTPGSHSPVDSSNSCRRMVLQGQHGVCTRQTVDASGAPTAPLRTSAAPQQTMALLTRGFRHCPTLQRWCPAR
jgi:hypothetical protein